MAQSNEGATRIDHLWDLVVPPRPPSLEAVTLESDQVALLILDIERRTTNPEKRPRAVASVPRIAHLLAQARELGLLVIFSTTSNGSRSEILADVEPAAEESVVTASIDKFHGTPLAELLVQRNIHTLVMAGTAAEGAILHTAAAAAVRGYSVVVPVDCISSSELYAEQYVCWHLLNAPGCCGKVRLSAAAMIEFQGSVAAS